LTNRQYYIPIKRKEREKRKKGKKRIEKKGRKER
jgi:hypothetical protein